MACVCVMQHVGRVAREGSDGGRAEGKREIWTSYQIGGEVSGDGEVDERAPPGINVHGHAEAQEELCGREHAVLWLSGGWAKNGGMVLGVTPSAIPAR